MKTKNTTTAQSSPAREFDAMENRHLNSQVKHETFPHVTEKGRIKATIANLEHLFKVYGVTCQYDEILKKQTVAIDNGDSDNDLGDNSVFAQIRSLLALNDAPLSMADLLPALLEQSRVNPIFDFITSKAWDGADRLTNLFNTLDVDAAHYRYRELAVKTWLVQAVAAIDSAKHSPLKNATPKFELVLVLQGAQGAGKTTWFRSLLPKALGKYIIDGAHLDPADKDTVKKCIGSWICELGEIDSTFRRADIARLKAFLSNERDEIRLPYDRVASSFRRKTVFGASVNEYAFLVDSTGSRRFLPLAIKKCFDLNGLDLQQVWAQVWHMYTNGAAWWCDSELETLLVEQHNNHAEISPIVELITDHFNINEPIKKPSMDFRHYSTTQLIIECGIANPTKDQIKQVKALLEKNGFIQMAQKGLRGYWITKEYFDADLNRVRDNFDD
jgi:putative DNA primase/helicase